MFGSLFGIRNTAGFKPIAFNRGLPKDVSDEVLEKFSINFDLYPSWLTWKEISNKTK
jgi:hypothetical protein